MSALLAVASALALAYPSRPLQMVAAVAVLAWTGVMLLETR